MRQRRRLYVSAVLLILLAATGARTEAALPPTEAPHPPAANGTTYYVSSSDGSDDNDELSEGAPLETVARVNALDLQPSDSVRFKCGDVWPAEQLSINQLFRDGRRLTMGRWPNLGAGYAVIDGHTTGGSQNELEPTPLNTPDFCPALPPPNGNIVNVSTEAQLWTAVNTASPGDTLLLADGTYHLGQNGYYVWIDTPDVTLRSASGDRDAVVLDDNYSGTQIVTVAASNVTIADLTLKRARTHPIHVTSSDGGDTLNTLIYNVHIVDPGQQAIKINPHAARVHFPDAGEVACSHIELTDAGRAKVLEINGSCYTGGIDMHRARDWEIRDNVIQGFWCSSGLSEHGIHLWRTCLDPLVERNVLFNNARGIGFGMATSGTGREYADDPCPGTSGYVDHYRGVIRNNVVFANQAGLFSSKSGFDSGIGLWNACDVQVYHNTVVSTEAPFSSIEWRFPNTSVDLINNLVSHNLRARDGAAANQAGNLTNAPLSLFVDGNAGDVHLRPSAATAIDQGQTLGAVSEDFEGDSRPQGSAYDIGADEFAVTTPRVTDLRVLQCLHSSDTLTATLGWTPLTEAVTTTLSYSNTRITDETWTSASVFSDTIAGDADNVHVVVPRAEGETAYFALRSYLTGAQWSDLSNVVFCPSREVFLPLVKK